VATLTGSAAIRKALSDGDQGRAALPRNNRSLSVTKREPGKVLLCETANCEAGGDWLHKSYIAK